MENNKLTPKQRAKIYLEAAEYFSEISGKNDWNLNNYYGFCDYLQWYKKTYLSSIDFPEYFLFKPKVKSMRNYWFETHKNNKIIQEDRITALLFAYQMALDATE